MFIVLALYAGDPTRRVQVDVHCLSSLCWGPNQEPCDKNEFMREVVMMMMVMMMIMVMMMMMMVVMMMMMMMVMVMVMMMMMMMMTMTMTMTMIETT